MKKKIIRACTVSQSFIFVQDILPQLSERYDVQLLACPERPIAEIERDFPVKYHPVGMNRRMSPLKDIKSLFQIVRIFRREKPAMVHSMTPKAGLLCMMAAWWTHVPVRIHTFTGLVWPTETGMKRRILMMTDKVTCACATHIIPEGEGVKDDLLNGRITKKAIKVLGYGNVRGVDMVRFSHRPELADSVKLLRDDSKFTFVFVGRIVHDKGMDELVEAFCQLKDADQRVRLWLIGNFEDSLDSISDATRDSIANVDGIEFLGPQYGDDLVAHYAAADCFVFPSYREGFPNTVLEAGAMGLPSIVTDINGSREIIRNGENGLIVPSKDTKALYCAMEELIANYEMRDKMASNARKMIAERFDKVFVQQCLLDYYEEIMPS